MRHYFEESVEITGEKNFRLFLSKGLVSRRGIYRVFANSDFAHHCFLEGKIFHLRVGIHPFMGKLVREIGQDGTFYSFVFLETEIRERQYLARQLEMKGVEAPWKREFPRIPSGKLPEDFDYPTRVFFPRVIGTVQGEVLNFSVHGLLFEFVSSGTSLGEYVGQNIRMDLTTVQTRKIRDIEAKIMRVYDEILMPHRVLRGLGVKFLGLKGDGGREYKEVLLTVCHGLSRELEIKLE